MVGGRAIVTLQRVRRVLPRVSERDKKRGARVLTSVSERDARARGFKNYMYSNDDVGSGRLAAIVSTRIAINNYHSRL